MDVIVTVPWLRSSGGGPYRAIQGLCGNLSAEVGCDIVTTDLGESGEGFLNSEGAQLPFHLVHGFGTPNLRFVFAPSFRATLLKLCASKQKPIIYDVGLWHHTNHVAASVSRQLGIPFVISPCGCLMDWTFKHKLYKKLPAWWLYQRKDLNSAFAVHATSNREAEAIRTFGYSGPIAVVPLGVDLPAQSVNKATSERIVLSISRMHRVKGLVNLIKAWSVLRPPFWRVVIAGPDESNHRAELIREASDLGVSGSITFLDEVRGPEKEELFRAASLFVLPSYTENFSVAVAEALSYGLPVITTTGTPWHELRSRSCGWWIDIGVEPLVHALKDALSCSADQLSEMGNRGRLLIEEKYQWASVAQKMGEVFSWILGLSPKPSSVEG